MAEEDEVNYASVVFKDKKKIWHEDKKEEETVYAEVKVQGETPEQTGDTYAAILPNKKANKEHRHNLQLACCLGILCVTLLLGVIAVCVYFTTFSHDSEQKQLKENITSLLAANHNLTNRNHKLRLENEKLRQDKTNLTVQVGNLTQDYRVLENKIANVTEENKNLQTQNQNLTTQNQQFETRNKDLETRNQDLERQKNNLTEKIQDVETKSNERNVSQAQWSIDAYCRKENDKRQCEPCQKHWSHSESSCFAINNAESADLKTWDEAREDCRGKISDLAVIVDPKEKNYTSANSWRSSGTNGYWIGLKAEDRKWTWVDGSDLTETSWMEDVPTDGHCAISVQNQGWKSVNCTAKNMWICGKKAVSV